MLTVLALENHHFAAVMMKVGSGKKPVDAKSWEIFFSFYFELLLDLQESCKIIQRMPVYPSHNILHSLSENFKNREINMGTIPLANLKTLFKLYNGSFSTDVIFPPRIPLSIVHCTCYFSLIFCSLQQFLSLSLFLMILITLKSIDQLFC